jgi:hypothetical protein
LRALGDHAQWVVTVAEQLVRATAAGKLQSSVSSGAMQVKTVLACSLKQRNTTS